MKVSERSTNSGRVKSVFSYFLVDFQGGEGREEKKKEKKEKKGEKPSISGKIPISDFGIYWQYQYRVLAPNTNTNTAAGRISCSAYLAGFASSMSRLQLWPRHKT